MVRNKLSSIYPLVVFIILLLASSMQSILLGNSQAFAATNPKVPCTTFSNDKIVGDTKLDWVDRAHIRAVIGGDVTNTLFFEDVNIDDQVDQFEVMNYDGCFGRVNLPDRTGLVSNKDSTAILDLDFKDNNDSSSQNTDPGKVSIIVGSRQNSKILYRYTDSSHITYVANGKADGDQVGWDGTFTQSTSNPNLFLQDRDTAETCRDRISVQPDGRVIFYALSKDGSVPSPPDAHDPSCKVGYVNNNITPPVRSDGSLDTTASSIPIAPVDNGSSYAGLAPLPGGVGDASATEPSCESEGGSFSWLMCPALELVSGILNFIDSQLNSLLNLPDSYYKCQPDGSGCTVKNAWSRMRNLAYIILIPVMLVMVISTALGFKFVDAYTVKRAMPRLLAAVIFISLSLPIVTIMADIANGVGKGIMGLILGAVTGDNANNITLASLFDPGLGGDGLLAVGIGGGGLLVAGLAASTMAIGLIGVVLLFGLSAVASIIVLFFVMALRQMILVTLMILSPLAILSWIFPGNDKLWKIWKESFTKLLMLYPIVMLLIASGKAFAFIVDGVSESSFLNRILVLVAYIAPYFLIKGTFKLAGSTFGNLAGMVNDRSKGLFDRNKKIRSKLLGNSMKKGISAAQGGKFLRGKDTERLKKWNEKIQSAAHYNSILDTGIKDGLTRSGRKATIGAAIQATEKQHQKHILEDKLIDTWINYDDLSGMAGDVVFSNEEGIRRRFMMKGVGVRMVKKKDADGNDTDEDSDEVYFDSKGQMEVTNNDLLNSKVNDVMSKIKAGDRAGALRSGLITSKAFEKVGADGSTYTDTSELERNVAHVIKASREHGDEALGQALVKKAVAGGTYYQNAADAWRAADLAVGHDGAARADMAASLRGIAINAGRIDQGGGAFGKTLGFMDQLHKINARLGQATTEEQKTAIREEFNNLQRQYMEHVIDNQPASNLYHPSMKENYVGRNITSVQRERLLDAAEKAQGKPEGSAEQEHLIRLMADADNTHNFAQQSKPSFARDVGDKLMDLKLPESDALKITIPAKVELQPTGILDASGKEIMREVVVQGAEEKLAENVRAGVAYLKGSGNKTYQKYQRQWSSDDEAEARQSNAAFEAAAKAGANNKPGGGINNKPTGGLNT